MPKPKFALYWCGSCGGCEEAIVDLAEELLQLVAAIDIVFWPVALDFKKSDVAALADRELTATLLNGVIRTQEQAEMARLLRRKSRFLVAFGACACDGGIPGLANQFSREDILRFTYDEAPTLEGERGKRPQMLTRLDGVELELPEVSEVVRTLDQVVEVDYYLPGCPPPTKLIAAALQTLLSENPPSKGSVLAPDTALCEECARRATKPSDLKLTEFLRAHQVKLDPGKCLLAQGVFCLGPATRSGCAAACLAANMPCSGCAGPTSRVQDVGAKILSAYTANLVARTTQEIDRALDGVPDPVGTFYRYGLPGSLLRRRVDLPVTASERTA